MPMPAYPRLMYQVQEFPIPLQRLIPWPYNYYEIYVSPFKSYRHKNEKKILYAMLSSHTQFKISPST